MTWFRVARKSTPMSALSPLGPLSLIRVGSALGSGAVRLPVGPRQVSGNHGRPAAGRHWKPALGPGFRPVRATCAPADFLTPARGAAAVSPVSRSCPCRGPRGRSWVRPGASRPTMSRPRTVTATARRWNGPGASRGPGVGQLAAVLRALPARADRCSPPAGTAAVCGFCDQACLCGFRATARVVLSADRRPARGRARRPHAGNARTGRARRVRGLVPSGAAGRRVSWTGRCRRIRVAENVKLAIREITPSEAQPGHLPRS